MDYIVCTADLSFQLFASELNGKQLISKYILVDGLYPFYARISTFFSPHYYPENFIIKLRTKGEKMQTVIKMEHERGKLEAY